jgi:hypothetical protein
MGGKNTIYSAKSAIFAAFHSILTHLKTVLMSQTGKQSAKRSKPSYFMAILGVTLVLFIVGVLGWVVLNPANWEQVLGKAP